MVNLFGSWVSQGTATHDGVDYYVLTLNEASVEVSAASTIVVTNELGGVTVFGTDGDDELTVPEAGSAVSAGGDDIIVLDSTNFTQIDGGEGYDVVDISRESTSLDTTLLPATALTDIEEITMLRTTGITNSLTLSAEDVIAATDSDNELVVSGETRDYLYLQGEWTEGEDRIIGDTTYKTVISEDGQATVVYTAGIRFYYTNPTDQISEFGVGEQAGTDPDQLGHQ